MQRPRKYFRIGQKVFVKTQDLPPWPAKVVRVDRAYKRIYKVLLYGSYFTIEVKRHQIYPFETNKKKMVNIQSVRFSGFLKALKEAEDDKSAKDEVPVPETLTVKEEKTVDDLEEEIMEIRHDTGTQTNGFESQPAIVDLESPSIGDNPTVEPELEQILDSTPSISVPEPTLEPLLPSSPCQSEHNNVLETVSFDDVPEVSEEISVVADNCPGPSETTSLNISAVITSISEAEDPSKLQYLGSFEVPSTIEIESDDENEEEEDSDDDEPVVITKVVRSAIEGVPRVVVELDENGEPKVSEVMDTKPPSTEKPRNVETFAPLDEPEFIEIAYDEEDLPKEMEELSVLRPKLESKVEKNDGADEILSIVLSSSSEDEAEEDCVTKSADKSGAKECETAGTRTESSPTSPKRNLEDADENEPSPKRLRIGEKNPSLIDEPNVSDGEASDDSQNVTGGKVTRRSTKRIDSESETSLNTNSPASSRPISPQTNGGSSTLATEVYKALDEKIMSRTNAAESNVDSDSESEHTQETASYTPSLENFLRKEGKMLRLESEIRRALSVKNPNVIDALAHLNNLRTLDIEALMLKKHPIVIDTVRKLRRYIGPPDYPGITTEEREFYVKESRKIRKKADEVLENQIKPLFNRPPVSVSFWDMFYDTLEQFWSQTASLTDDQVAMLTSE